MRIRRCQEPAVPGPAAFLPKARRTKPQALKAADFSRFSEIAGLFRANKPLCGRLIRHIIKNREISVNAEHMRNS